MQFVYSKDAFPWIPSQDIVRDTAELNNYVPLPMVIGNILVSMQIPGVGVDVTVRYPQYLLNQWVEFYQTCMDTLLELAKKLIKFW